MLRGSSFLTRSGYLRIVCHQAFSSDSTVIPPGGDRVTRFDKPKKDVMRLLAKFLKVLNSNSEPLEISLEFWLPF